MCLDRKQPGCLVTLQETQCLTSGLFLSGPSWIQSIYKCLKERANNMKLSWTLQVKGHFLDWVTVVIS